MEMHNKAIQQTIIPLPLLLVTRCYSYIESAKFESAIIKEKSIENHSIFISGTRLSERWHGA